MGHSRLGVLPRTKQWDEVVGLIGVGAAAGQVATATLDAVEKWLATAHKDVGVVETVRLLMTLPLAARAGTDFGAELRGRGLDVGDSPGLMDVIGAVSAKLDAATPNNRGRTDLGELAQAALSESLSSVIGGHLPSLFGTSPGEVQAAFGRHATVARFGELAHDFFGRFAAKFLDCYLSRTLPLHVGAGKRFDSLAAVGRFEQELRQHCRERARIVERFAGEWLSKERWEAGGDVSPRRAADFVYGSMRKLTAELHAAGAA